VRRRVAVLLLCRLLGRHDWLPPHEVGVYAIHKACARCYDEVRVGPGGGG